MPTAEAGTSGKTRLLPIKNAQQRTKEPRECGCPNLIVGDLKILLLSVLTEVGADWTWKNVVIVPLNTVAYV